MPSSRTEVGPGFLLFPVDDEFCSFSNSVDSCLWLSSSEIIIDFSLFHKYCEIETVQSEAIPKILCKSIYLENHHHRQSNVLMAQKICWSYKITQPGHQSLSSILVDHEIDYNE